jgi:uncharacterized membrane protein (UPF0127 family)
VKITLRNTAYPSAALLFFSFVFFIFIKPILYKPVKQCDLFFSNHSALYDVPLAETKMQQEKGLSGKESAEKGMLFRFDRPKIVTFWMKDTKMPLSIGFFSAEGVLFQIEEMLPYTQTPHPSYKKASEALELPKGGFEKNNITLGSKLMTARCDRTRH